jgi:hypothetical protein
VPRGFVARPRALRESWVSRRGRALYIGFGADLESSSMLPSSNSMSLSALLERRAIALCLVRGDAISPGYTDRFAKRGCYSSRDTV